MTDFFMHNYKFTKQREAADDEYRNEQGMLCCKACHKPREIIFEEIYRLPVPCDCETKAYEAEQAEAKRIARESRIAELRDRGIPIIKYHKWNFANDDNQTPNTTSICKRYVSKFEELRGKGQGLLFYGDKGTGKTFYAMCIANALIDEGYNAWHTSLSTVIRYAQDFDNAEKHFNDMMNKSCIILDDLGTERDTPFAYEQIFRYIDGWVSHDVPLIVTTNFSLEEIEKVKDDVTQVTLARIYSRILEKCFPIKVNRVRRRDNNAEKNREEMQKLLGLK